MKLKFKEYEASGSPKEMAEFLRLTQEKMECRLPEDFEERWVEDFKRRWNEMMDKNAEGFNTVGVVPNASETARLAVLGGNSVLDRYMLKPNKFKDL